MEEETVQISAPIFKDGRFENPWKSWTGVPGPIALVQWKCESDKSDIPSKQEELDKVLPIEKPNFISSQPENCLRATWIGHATVFVQIDGANVITDPIWSERCSPVSVLGPKRYRKPPCEIGELPQVDIAVISHNHYDHLDKTTVKQLEKHFGTRTQGDKQPSGLQWFVPKGLADWMHSVGCKNVREMSWGEETEINVASSGKSIKIVSLPAQHWSTRNGISDRNKSLWGGWGIIGSKHRFFFAGDTGYTDEEFKKIGKLYGPFDLAAIPIGCYCPRWFMRPQHVDPKDAVNIHKDIRAKHSLGIHWGTFHMGSTEFYLEPKINLAEEVAKAGLSAESFVTKNIGETWEL